MTISLFNQETEPWKVVRGEDWGHSQALAPSQAGNFHFSTCAFLLPASSPASPLRLPPPCVLTSLPPPLPTERKRPESRSGLVTAAQLGPLLGVCWVWRSGESSSAGVLASLSFIPLEHFRILKSSRSEGILMSHSVRPQGSDDFDPDPWDLQSPGQVQPPCVTSHKNRFTKNEPRKYKHSASSITCSCSISKEAVQGWLKQQKCTS